MRLLIPLFGMILLFTSSATAYTVQFDSIRLSEDQSSGSCGDPIPVTVVITNEADEQKNIVLGGYIWDLPQDGNDGRRGYYSARSLEPYERETILANIDVCDVAPGEYNVRMLISECLDDWCLDLMPVDLIEAGPVTVTAVVNQFNFTLLALAIVLGIVVFVLVKFRSPADEGRKWTTMEVRCPKCKWVGDPSDYIGTATCPACKAQFNEFRDSRIN